MGEQPRDEATGTEDKRTERAELGGIFSMLAAAVGTALQSSSEYTAIQTAVKREIGKIAVCEKRHKLNSWLGFCTGKQPSGRQTRLLGRLFEGSGRRSTAPKRGSHGARIGVTLGTPYSIADLQLSREVINLCGDEIAKPFQRARSARERGKGIRLADCAVESETGRRQAKTNVLAGTDWFSAED